MTEVQELLVYGSRLLEVQTITTTAQVYASVQEFVLTAPTGHPLVGNFTLRFPQLQNIVMSAEYADQVSGSFQLVYSYYDYTLAMGSQLLTVTTACLSVTASNLDVQAALEAVAPAVIDSVEVIRSGYGGYSDNFGYSWMIAFSGILFFI